VFVLKKLVAFITFKVSHCSFIVTSVLYDQQCMFGVRMFVPDQKMSLMSNELAMAAVLFS